MSIEDRVASGARLLDREMPDWFRKVSMHGLNIQHERKCVLGYCYGVYSAGLKALKLDSDSAEPADYGFHYFRGNKPDDTYHEAAGLEAAWRQEIQRRLN